MFDLKTTVNTVGIILTLVGVYAVYYYSPINSCKIDGGNASTDFEKIERYTDRRNLLLKCGVYVVMVGTFFQLVSNYIP